MNLLLDLWIDGYTAQRAAYVTGIDPLITKILWRELNDLF